MTDFSLVGPPASPIRSTQHPIQWFSIIQRKLALTAPESNLFHTRAVIILQNAVASLDRKSIGSIWRYFFPVDGSAQDQTRPKPGVMRSAGRALLRAQARARPGAVSGGLGADTGQRRAAQQFTPLEADGSAASA